MEYQHVSDYAKVNALNERMGQLETAHYSNSVYLMESEGIGDAAAVQRFRDENHGIEAQWEIVRTERDRLLEKLETENPSEVDEESDAGELRSEPSS